MEGYRMPLRSRNIKELPKGFTPFLGVNRSSRRKFVKEMSNHKGMIK